MFRGAETVFREILVPLAGMQEMLIRRDAEMLKRQVLANVPPERQRLVLNEIATSLEQSEANLGTFKTDYNTIV